MLLVGPLEGMVECLRLDESECVRKTPRSEQARYLPSDKPLVRALAMVRNSRFRRDGHFGSGIHVDGTVCLFEVRDAAGYRLAVGHLDGDSGLLPLRNYLRSLAGE